MAEYPNFQQYQLFRISMRKGKEKDKEKRKNRLPVELSNLPFSGAI